MAGKSYLLIRISLELGRYRELFEQRMSCFPGPSAEENVIFRYECTSYKTRLSCVVETILLLIDVSVYLLNLYFSLNKAIDSWGCWVHIFFMLFKQQFKSYTAFFLNVQSNI